MSPSLSSVSSSSVVSSVCVPSLWVRLPPKNLIPSLWMWNSHRAICFSTCRYQCILLGSSFEDISLRPTPSASLVRLSASLPPPQDSASSLSSIAWEDDHGLAWVGGSLGHDGTRSNTIYLFFISRLNDASG